MTNSSRIKQFYKKNRGEKLDALTKFTNLPVDQIRMLTKDGSLDFELTNLFIENAIGSFPMPFGICTNFKIDNSDYLLPMAVEESSVIAATSNAAKIVYHSGGFTTKTIESLMIGQVYLIDFDPKITSELKNSILDEKQNLIDSANDLFPRLVQRGGGAKDIKVKLIENKKINFNTLQIHLFVDTKDAMGANIINTMCEGIAPIIEQITKQKALLKILSNLASEQLYYAKCEIDFDLLATKEIDGEIIAKDIVNAYLIADNDPYRATTHNKGIMNGVDPIIIATGNDWRAIEAGAHAYASITGRYRSLSKWQIKNNKLIGEITLPLQIGTVGGVTRLHPIAKLSLQILNQPKSDTLSRVICCAGLAANLAALRALVSTGIQKGHMRMHAKNVALLSGAEGKEIEVIASQLVINKKINVANAEIILKKLREGNINYSKSKKEYIDNLI